MLHYLEYAVGHYGADRIVEQQEEAGRQAAQRAGEHGLTRQVDVARNAARNRRAWPAVAGSMNQWERTPSSTAAQALRNTGKNSYSRIGGARCATNSSIFSSARMAGSKVRRRP